MAIIQDVAKTQHTSDSQWDVWRTWQVTTKQSVWREGWCARIFQIFSLERRLALFSFHAKNSDFNKCNPIWFNQRLKLFPGTEIYQVPGERYKREVLENRKPINSHPNFSNMTWARCISGMLVRDRRHRYGRKRKYTHLHIILYK